MEFTLQRRSLLLGAVGLSLAGCAAPAEMVGTKGTRLTPLKSFSSLASAGLLKLAGVKGISAHYTVDCYRVVYGSHDGLGNPISLSGLLALPRGTTARGLVSWQHGTTTTRDQVPSNLSTEGVAAAIVFAGNGFATLAPDYVGLGQSRLTHTYLVADDAARAVIDLIDSVAQTPGVPSTAPFLIGFSQGGHASLAAQRELEAKGRAVLASAPVAGPHNLRTISLPAALRGGAASHPLYLSYMTRGYAARYNRSLESVLTVEAAALVRTLYDQPHKPDAIVAALPRTPRSLFNAEFLDAFDSGGKHWLLEALAANETKQTPAMERFIETLTALIMKYEDEIEIEPERSPGGVLKYMMEERGLRQIDLVPILGSKPYVSQILSGHRPIGKDAAHKLAEYFQVSAYSFI